jgi:hypothetical protein
VVGGLSDTNCAFSGAGTLQLAPTSSVLVDWKRENYRANVASTGQYNINTGCDPGSSQRGPVNGVVFTTGIVEGPGPLPFGSESLTGNYSDPLAFAPTSDTWDLKGQER